LNGKKVVTGFAGESQWGTEDEDPVRGSWSASIYHDDFRAAGERGTLRQAVTKK
jgi:hypothetical protein